jgi:hypothetical protein
MALPGLGPTLWWTEQEDEEEEGPEPGVEGEEVEMMEE